MGSLKDFQIFLMNNPQMTMRAAREEWRRGSEQPTIEVTDDHDLTWDEVDLMSGSALGTFSFPCPYCGPNKAYSRRFQIRRRTYSTATYHCFYCGRSGSANATGPVDPVKEAEARKAAAKLSSEQKDERAAQALHWWDEAASLSGIVTARTYFRARSIFELPPNTDDVLRWHPKCPFDHTGKRPLLLALFRDATTNEPRAIHRTLILNDKRGLATRRSLGPRSGCAIKLWPLGGEQLFICEGIENALAAAAMTYDGTPARPVWAATVANNLPTIAVVPGVKRLIILGDNDPVGEMNAQQLAGRWRDGGRDVRLVLLKKQGQDWNDVVRSE